MYKVVIIEDSPLLRTGMVHTLDWASVDCQIIGSAGDGLEGLALIENVKPDIIITDIKMPGLSGLEMVEQAMLNGSRASVIFISGYDDFQYAQKALKLGAVEYLIKPLEDEDTYRAVRSASAKVDERRRLDELERRLDAVEGSKVKVFQRYLDGNESIKSEYTQHAIDYIAPHYGEDINVRSIANALSISESHLSKVFKDTLQSTIGEYLTHYRITEACKMLQNTKMKVYEVAVRCGYSDQRYFSVIFKRIMCMTPNEFRAHNAARDARSKEPSHKTGE